MVKYLLGKTMLDCSSQEGPLEHEMMRDKSKLACRNLKGNFPHGHVLFICDGRYGIIGSKVDF